MEKQSRIRDEQQERLLLAAAELVATLGAEAVTMASVAHRSGISRTAVYQYFDSRDHILGELVINDMADLANLLDQKVSVTEDPVEQLKIWVRQTLDYLISPSHRLVKEVSIQKLPADIRALVRGMHGQFMLTLLSPLAKLSPDDSQALAGYVYSAVVACASRIEKGGDLEDEAATLERFVLLGVIG
ncbi:MAG: hypothetical protein RIR81_460 [Actinomycetota bacterium]|jgi:AcrR family transcriptional regulator